MNCPFYNALYRYNDFLTPGNEVVRELASRLISTNNLHSCFNYVSRNIQYITDRAQYGYDEHWAFPEETLYRGRGDCEDTSFLLASLLIAIGVSSHEVRVVLGYIHGQGHAWVECYTTDMNWVILESTSDNIFRIGSNVFAHHIGYRNGYTPTTYVYTNSCTSALF